MTLKMEGSGEMEGSKDIPNEPVVAAGKKDGAGNADEGILMDSKFVRERNLLLLSAVYNQIGDKCDPPDWVKIVDMINEAKIPTFGKGFTPEKSEAEYKKLIGEGFQVGIGELIYTLKAPKRLTEAEKRLYILANTANDLVAMSRIMDTKIRNAYVIEQAKIETIDAGAELNPLKDLALSDDSDNEIDNKMDFDEYENPVTQEVSLENEQEQLIEEIIGLQDVLPLLKYCQPAVQYAQRQCELLGIKLLTNTPPSRKTSPTKSHQEKHVEFSKSIVSMNQVSQELNYLVHTAIANTSEAEKPKNTAVAPAAPTLSKLLELPVTTPGMPLPEIPSPVKPDATPEKSPVKSASRGSSKDRTLPLPEMVKEESASEIEDLPKGNGESTTTSTTSVSITLTPSKLSSKADTNGEGNASDVTIQSPEKSLPEKSSPEKSLPLKNDESTEKLNEENDSTTNKQEVSDDATKEKATETPIPCDEPSKTETLTVPEVKTDVSTVPEGESEITTDNESEPNEGVQTEPPTKDKQSDNKKGTTARSTRTSSRLTSPEPAEKPFSDEDKSVNPKKTLSRQSSASESHTPTLRSRSRGATPPTKPVTENETTKTETASRKLDFVDDMTEEETFETPLSTPESPEIKSDAESIQETKPPKQLKVYSATPAAPLSHVDAKLFNEFIDDEDDPELILIDNTANKAKSDKSPTKAGSRRGRTASSENTSDAGNNDDAAQSKRVTRKTGVVEDMDEDSTSNNDDGASKRLTRSSLKEHDAANEARGAEPPRTESEKGGSESSFGGKEKKPRTSKSMSRVKGLQQDFSRLYGDGEELPEGKRVTRARARTSVTQSDKRSKPPSVGDSEGLSESEPTPTRATRSRSSTASSMPVLEPTSSQQAPPPADDEEQKAIRKNALSLLDKVVGNDFAIQLQKYFQDDPNQILKKKTDFQTIRKNIENGKARTISAVYCDLTTLAVNALMAHPNSSAAKETISSYYKFIKSCLEDVDQRNNQLALKNDNSDVESLESHDEQRSETSSKQPGGGRRKRKRSVSETSEDIQPQENKRRVTRTSTSTPQQSIRKTKHPISPDIVSANRVRH